MVDFHDDPIQFTESSVILKHGTNIIVTNRRWMAVDPSDHYYDTNLSTLVVNDSIFKNYDTLDLKHIECLHISGFLNREGVEILIRYLPNLKKLRLTWYCQENCPVLKCLLEAISKDECRLEEIVDDTTFIYEYKELKCANIKVTSNKNQTVLDEVVKRNKHDKRLREIVMPSRRVCAFILLNLKVFCLITGLSSDVVIHILKKMVYQPENVDEK